MANEKKEEWEKIEAEVFRFEKEGDSIEGEYISSAKGQFDNLVYKIKTDEGLKAVFGSAILDSRMDGVPVGVRVKFVFTGTQPHKNPKFSPIKLFDIYVKRK